MPQTSSEERPPAPGHIRIDNRVITHYGPRIGALALAVYVVLGLHADARTRQCYPSIRTISRLSRLSRPTVLKAISKLEEVGLVRVERRRTKGGEREVNVYTLLPLAGGQPGLPPVVNDVDHRGKGALPEQDLINKTQKNKRECCPPTFPPSVRPSGLYLDHPAVRGYQEEFGLMPNETQREEIAAVVTDLARWKAVMRWWQLKDYRKTNVVDMLDRYKKGVSGRSDGDGRHAFGGRSGAQGNRLYDRRESRPRETPEEAARLDAEWQSLVEQSRGRGQHDEG